MSSQKTPQIWLVGAGVMAQDYFKILHAMGHVPVVIGRSLKSVEAFAAATGHEAVAGGIEGFLSGKPTVPDYAIVAVSRETLADVTCLLCAYGVKNILVEKPAGLSQSEIDKLTTIARDLTVVVGFNRRFYASVEKARELILEDGGVLSFNFEFTEWSHLLKDLVPVKGAKVMSTWFLGNSVHVPDLAFYLGGAPRQIVAFTAAGSDWHPASSIFAGAGVAENGALFSYQANWDSAGRWSVEVLTPKRRLILRPLEELHVQKKGAVAIERVELDRSLEEKFKPGLYLQVQEFLAGRFDRFADIQSLQRIFPTYLQMAGYSAE